VKIERLLAREKDILKVEREEDIWIKFSGNRGSLPDC